jgi:hypothetical protein
MKRKISALRIVDQQRERLGLTLVGLGQGGENRV